MAIYTKFYTEITIKGYDEDAGTIQYQLIDDEEVREAHISQFKADDGLNEILEVAEATQ